MDLKNLTTYAEEKKALCLKHDTISDTLFEEFGVNRGLRDINGKGVLTGLTNISKVSSFKEENGQKIPCDGELWYRGYQVNNLIDALGENEFGFEKTAYLLLFGELPTEEELKSEIESQKAIFYLQQKEKGESMED